MPFRSTGFRRRVNDMALEMRNVRFGYGNAPLFADVNLTIEPDERVALIAPSGTGKTTLCRLLAGYERPQAGTVTVDGQHLPKKGACPVQLIGQHPEQTLDPLMRMEDSLHEAGEPDSALLDALGIQRRWLSRYPHELSGGELQRFCIARALLVNPRYVIADEITTMLDAVTQATLWRFLLDEQRRKNWGMAFVSHSEALTKRIATRAIDVEALICS